MNLCLARAEAPMRGVPEQWRRLASVCDKESVAGESPGRFTRTPGTHQVVVGQYNRSQAVNAACLQIGLGHVPPLRLSPSVDKPVVACRVEMKY